MENKSNDTTNNEKIKQNQIEKKIIESKSTLFEGKLTENDFTQQPINNDQIWVNEGLIMNENESEVNQNIAINLLNAETVEKIEEDSLSFEEPLSSLDYVSQNEEYYSAKDFNNVIPEDLIVEEVLKGNGGKLMNNDEDDTPVNSIEEMDCKEFNDGQSELINELKDDGEVDKKKDVESESNDINVKIIAERTLTNDVVVHMRDGIAENIDELDETKGGTGKKDETGEQLKDLTVKMIAETTVTNDVVVHMSDEIAENIDELDEIKGGVGKMDETGEQCQDLTVNMIAETTVMKYVEDMSDEMMKENDLMKPRKDENDHRNEGQTEKDANKRQKDETKETNVEEKSQNYQLLQRNQVKQANTTDYLERIKDSLDLMNHRKRINTDSNYTLSENKEEFQAKEFMNEGSASNENSDSSSEINEQSREKNVGLNVEQGILSGVRSKDESAQRNDLVSNGKDKIPQNNLSSQKNDSDAMKCENHDAWRINEIWQKMDSPGGSEKSEMFKISSGLSDKRRESRDIWLRGVLSESDASGSPGISDISKLNETANKNDCQHNNVKVTNEMTQRNDNKCYGNSEKLNMVKPCTQFNYFETLRNEGITQSVEDRNDTTAKENNSSLQHHSAKNDQIQPKSNQNNTKITKEETNINTKINLRNAFVNNDIIDNVSGPNEDIYQSDLNKGDNQNLKLTDPALKRGNKSTNPFLEFIYDETVYENQRELNNQSDNLVATVSNVNEKTANNQLCGNDDGDDLNLLNTDDNSLAVACITTSVVNAPFFETVAPESLRKFSNSIEHDSLNSDSYSSGSNDSIDKAGVIDNSEYPNQNFKYDDELKNVNEIVPFSNKIQTCGKCKDDLSRIMYKDTELVLKNSDDKNAKDKYNGDSDKVNDKNDKFKDEDDQNDCYDGRTPRNSEPALTDISVEKRSSLFRKMSTLTLTGGRDGSNGNDINKSCLLEDSSTKFDWRRLLAQVLAVSAKNTLALNFGMSVGFQTIAIPSLQNPNSELHLTMEQISLYGSLFFTIIPIGCLLSGPTIHGWGRKPAMLLFCIPLFISWWIYYFAKSPGVLYLAILLMGMINGLLEAPVLTYVAEITEARWRGMLASSSIVAALFGVFLQLLFGTMMTWRTAAIVNSIFPVISFICICFVPESPHWLASKERVKDVEKSLMWLRGWTDKESVAAEVDKLIAEHKEPKVSKTPLSWNAYTSRTFIEPFLLVIGSFAIGHFSGMATVQTYSVMIFDSFGVDGLTWTAGMGATQVLGALACVIMLPMLGKRPISVLAMIGVAIGMTGAATASGKLAASSLLLANFGTNACSRVVPWVLIGEVFTNEMRAVASGLSSSICYILSFVLSYTYLRVEAALTLRVVLGVYAGVGLLGAIGYYLFLPETEGKSLTEVQEYFAKKKEGVDNHAFEKEKP